MLRNINKSLSFWKGFFVILIAIFFVIDVVNAKEIKPITPKLWKVLSEKDHEILHKISSALDAKKYEEALRLAKQIDDKKDEIVITQDPQAAPAAVIEKHSFQEALVNLILWKKYSEGGLAHASFNDISRFVNDNPFYPNISELRRAAEKLAVEDHVPYRLSEQYFKSNPASTAESKIYLLEAKSDFLLRFKGSENERLKMVNEIQMMISDIWIKENLTLAQEQEFFSKHASQLTESDHIKRVNRLLWDNKIGEAKRIFNLVNDDWKKLFSAIIEIKESPKYIDNIMLSVPRNLRLQDNLTYNRILWLKNHDRVDDLLELLEKVEQTEYPEKWWNLRRLYAREMLKKKEYKLAYNLVSKHGMSAKSNDYWEAEWMSGWISLRFLDRSRDAYKHFEALRNGVSQPVSLARAEYWLGMAAKENGDKNKAIEWFKSAAKYPVFFYGQLAIHKHRMLDSVNAHDDIILPKDPDVTVGDIRKMSTSMSTKIAYLMALMGQKAEATKVFEWTVNNATSDGQIAVVMRIVNELKDRQMDARISRVAAKKNVFFIRDKFQIVKEVAQDEYAPLVHAIIKQESGFAPTALSQVGAIGFMQLMPDTAKLVCKDMGIPYNRHKLATDIRYNVKLGSHYIKQLIDRFEGSEMLAIASYNAGPNATQRWINEFYDPRKEKDIDKVVDWIELITYSETRNYVQRIMENLIVYKYLMSRSNYDSIN